jgi:hypothetical protein
VLAELCSAIVHVTELSSASSQCWLALSGMSFAVFVVTSLLRRVRCRRFDTSAIVMASELNSAIAPVGSCGLRITVIAPVGSWYPKGFGVHCPVGYAAVTVPPFVLLPWGAEEGCTCGGGYGSVSSVECGAFLGWRMYWGSGFLRLVCALARFVDRFLDGGVYRGGSGFRLPMCVVDQFFQSASL